MHIQFNYQLVLKMNLNAIIDLVEMNAVFYGNDDLGTDIEVGEIPEEYQSSS